MGGSLPSSGCEWGGRRHAGIPWNATHISVFHQEIVNRLLQSVSYASRLPSGPWVGRKLVRTVDTVTFSSVSIIHLEHTRVRKLYELHEAQGLGRNE